MVKGFNQFRNLAFNLYISIRNNTKLQLNE
jgi:hypothetical protein